MGAKGGPNSQQAHDVVTTSMRRNDVASTSFRRLVLIRFLINQCQIITFLILEYDITENSRIELRGIVLPVQVGGLLGGAKGYVGPPSQIIGGAWPPLAPPLPTPMALLTDRADMTIAVYRERKATKQQPRSLFFCNSPILDKYDCRFKETHGKQKYMNI